MGGEIGLLQEGDTIEINIPEGTVNAKVSPEEFEARRKTYTMKECPIKEGWLPVIPVWWLPPAKGLS